jgi:hypothetical protein
MQTNAPAGSEFVDQYNRAVAFGQIGGANGAPLPAHASTHATGGSDPVTPASIGAVSLVTNNAAIVPQSVYLRVDGINLLAALNTNTLLYTVPAGSTFTANSVKVIITSSNQSVGFGTAPEFEIQNGSGIKTCNVLSLAIAPRLFSVGDVILAGGSFGGGSTSRRTSTDTVNFKVVTAASGGTGGTMLATVFVQGELYS